jgi:septal ring factor EnvC (AmiA/AmiB activator)
MSITPNIPDSGDGYQTSSTPRWVPIVIAVLFVALGGGLFWLRSQGQSSEAELRAELTATKTRSDQLANALEETNQRLAQVSGQQQVTSQKLGLTQDELARARSFAQQIQKDQEAQQSKVTQQLNSQIGQVRQENEAKFGQVATDLTGTRNDIAATRKDLEDTKARLTSTVGDLGVQSGLIATNGKELAALKQLGERNYVEFKLGKTKAPQKVGDVAVLLKKTDPKKNRYTIDVVADDKTVEKKDKTINEPVQFLLSKASQPYELVVNEVRKDMIVGYVAAPKVQTPRN